MTQRTSKEKPMKVVDKCMGISIHHKGMPFQSTQTPPVDSKMDDRI